MTDDLRAKAHDLCKAIVPACVPITDDGAWEHSRFCDAILGVLRDVDREAEARTLRSVAIELRCFSWLAVQNYADQLDARAAETETK